jgi:hypothetical protein
VNTSLAFVLVASMFAFFMGVTVLRTEEITSTSVIVQPVKRMVLRRLANFVNTRPPPCAMLQATNFVSTMVPAMAADAFVKNRTEDRTLMSTCFIGFHPCLTDTGLLFSTDDANSE